MSRMLKKRAIKYPRYVTSKIGKTKAVEAIATLKQYVPTTKWMTAESLKQMLVQHKMVYIKPNVGMFGNGVIRVEYAEGSGALLPYSYQLGVHLKRFKTFEDMYASIIKKTGKERYLVQKGIHLLKYKGNRFDLRIMVQQTPERKWETTGVIGRVAHPTKIVTNFHNGGTLKPVDTLLEGYLKESEKEQFLKKLHVLGTGVARAIHTKYNGVKEIGVDVALDSELHPWILEVNTSPDPFIFRRLRDKRIFAKIRRYARAYGRL
ncbi:YheC/YheD family protein [Paenibacillus sp. GCM10023248]|uniref:YheC/YheD family protein n=1 Tax=Bacillales TaxID=1385 RepID=UPI0023791664|nr:MULTISPECIES: YheC/YheD family protein [Bacillales]MDD9271177.1 YheC/YheD family protein [Paenibacillus sp. MAHUQ-63]MDR6881706.1 glutathione synthase/RimK-type ligase-like ATP-grasp enzyme [Bacillus sp. 3255]